MWWVLKIVELFRIRVLFSDSGVVSTLVQCSNYKNTPKTPCQLRIMLPSSKLMWTFWFQYSIDDDRTGTRKCRMRNLKVFCSAKSLLDKPVHRRRIWIHFMMHKLTANYGSRSEQTFFESDHSNVWKMNFLFIGCVDFPLEFPSVAPNRVIKFN